MAITEADKRFILNQIKAESVDITNLPAVDSLEGVTSLPVLKDGELVTAAVEELSRPALEAAAVADTATANANSAAQSARELVEQQDQVNQQVQQNLDTVYQRLNAADAAAAAAQSKADNNAVEIGKSNTRINANAQAIGVINGDEETDGSIAQFFKNAKSYTDTQIATARGELESDIQDVIDAAAAAQATADNNTTEIGRSNANIAANAQAIGVINGDVNTAGSMAQSLQNAKQYADGVAADTKAEIEAEIQEEVSVLATKAEVNQKISDLINGAPETLDTLKELGDAIGENADAISAINALAATKADASNVYTKKQVDGKVSALNNAIAGENERATDEEARLEGLIGSNRTSITNESTRATQEEARLNALITTNANNISDEITRALQEEASLGVLINANNTSITAEVTRATLAEAAIEEKADTNAADIITINTRLSNLSTTLTSETQRAEGEESRIEGKVDSEAERATAAEEGLAGQISTLETSYNATKSLVEANQSAIETINGNASTEGSIAKSLADAKGYTDSAVATAKTQAGTAANAYTDQKIADLIGGAPETLNTLKEISDAITQSSDAVSALNTAIGTKANSSDVYTKTEIDGKVTTINNSISANTTAIQTINGSNTTAGSIAKAEKDCKDYTDSKVATAEGKIPTKTSQLTNDSNFTTNTGTVTSVEGGTGLNGGTITGSGTLSVKYGTDAGTACQGNDSRLSDSRTPKAHNQGSDTINALTNYSKPSTTSALQATDTLNQALGKLEKAIETKQGSGSYVTPTELTNTLSSYVTTSDSRLTDSRTPKAHNQASSTITTMSGYAKASAAAAIGESDTLNAAIGKLEKALDGKQASGSYATLTGSQALTNKTYNGYTLGAACAKGVATSIGATGSDSNLATEKAVRTAINALPTPMQFLGTLGTGGTITSLPEAATANNGYMYKVITAGTYQSVAAKVGDVLISNGTSWILVPSGDEPSGTVTSVTLTQGAGISITNSGTAITTSGSRTISLATSGATAGTYGPTADVTGSNNSTISVPSITVDQYGRVTSVTAYTLTNVNTDTNTDTHYTTHLYAGDGTAANKATTNGNTKVTLTDNSTVRNTLTIKGTGATTVTSDATGIITINSTDTNTHQSVTNKAATLSWGGTATLATIGSTDITVTMPANPNSNTHYTTHLYAGTGTAANATTTNGNTKITLTDDSTVRNSLTIKGTGATTVTSDANGVITINSTDTNTHQSVTNKAATLSWGGTATLATIGSTDITVTMPANPNTNTHYVTHLYAGDGSAANKTTTNGNTKIALYDDSTSRNTLTIKGTGATTVTSDASGVITINSTDNNTNTHYTTHLYAGKTGTASNQTTTNGNTYLVLADDTTIRNNIKIQGSGTTTVTSDANGVITISSADSKTGTVTSVAAGTGLSGGTITSSGTLSLADSGVTAGSAGPTANVTGTDGSTVSIPRITVDKYGRVTALSSYTLTNKNTANTDTHYTTHLYAGSGAAANATTTNGNTKLTVVDNTTVRDSIKITGSGGTTVTSASGTITITSPTIWTGTQAQYDAITSKNSSTLYFIKE